MSLTSYRAAPSRATDLRWDQGSEGIAFRQADRLARLVGAIAKAADAAAGA